MAGVLAWPRAHDPAVWRVRPKYNWRAGARPRTLERLGKTCKFIGVGGIDVTKSYKFIGFGGIDVTYPCKFIGFGGIDVTYMFKFAFLVCAATCRMPS